MHKSVQIEPKESPKKKGKKPTKKKRPRVPKTLGTFGDNHNGKYLHPF